MNSTFSVQHHELFTILAAMLPICTKRTTIDTTATLLIQVRQRELIIKATDLEIALQASCILEERENGSDETLSFLVPGKRLHDIVKELDGVIHCTITKGLFTLQAGGVTVQLNMGSGDPFPSFPERIENLMHMESDLLVEMLKGTAFVIPQQHSSNVLTGLLWELGPSGITLTATDGHCLAQTRTERYQLPEGRSWLIPRRAIFELLKLIELMKEQTIFIGICGKHIVFSGALFNFFTRLLTGTFPQYSSVLQRDQFIPARVERQQLVRTLRRATSLLAGQFIATQFQVASDQVQVTMHNKDVGNLREVITLNEYVGSDFEIRFYAPYLLHGLNVFNDEHVQLFLKGSKQPIIVASEYPSGVRVTYLVMPVAPTNNLDNAS
jgi:DNA polymerase-3 subunit beta